MAEDLSIFLSMKDDYLAEKKLDYRGYAVVVFDSRGMPRCVGLASNQDEVKQLIDGVRERRYGMSCPKFTFLICFWFKFV